MDADQLLSKLQNPGICVLAKWERENITDEIEIAKVCTGAEKLCESMRNRLLAEEG